MNARNTLLVSDLDGVRYITLNRPERLNALNQDVASALREVLSEAESTSDIRVVVLRGAGDKAFSVGADLKETTHSSENLSQSLEMFLPGLDVMPSCRLPIIAAVHGYCCGGGFELALAADILVCSESAQFWFPQTSLGLIPGSGTSRFIKAVGKTNAMEIVLTGRRVSGEEALRLGIASYVYPDSESLGHGVRALATSIATQPPMAVMLAKQSLLRGSEMRVNDALLEDQMRLFALHGTDDRKQASAAFHESRPSTVGR